MNLLAEMLSSRGRAEIFRLLFSGTVSELHNREIERRSGLSESAVRQELNKLKRLGLLISRKDSNRVYYQANRDHPLYKDIQNLVLKTSGLVDVLRKALSDKSIQIALVFGSIASGEETARSDVDLLVIGELGLRKLSGLLSGVAEKMDREINSHVFTPEAYKKRLRSKDHLVTSLLAGPKLFVFGSEHDLKTMGR
jgi:uncharacterized protein